MFCVCVCVCVCVYVVCKIYITYYFKVILLRTEQSKKTIFFKFLI